MKNIILLALILLSKIAFSQEIPPLELTKNGVEPIVVTIDNLTDNELQLKTLNWIQEYYLIEQPETYSKGIIKTDILNGTIRIIAIKKNAWSYESDGIKTHYDVEYFLLVNCEDNKINISVDFGNTWSQGKGVSQSTAVNYKNLWKENGEVHKVFKDTKQGIDHMMNELAFSLVNYLRDDINQNNRSTSRKQN
jgi:hypothetical protein